MQMNPMTAEMASDGGYQAPICRAASLKTTGRTMSAPMKPITQITVMAVGRKDGFGSLGIEGWLMENL